MACPGSIKSVSAEALVKLANEVAEIEQISAKPASRKPEHTAEFDSFAKFASEASRVRDAGRLPFGSDSCKLK